MKRCYWYRCSLGDISRQLGKEKAKDSLESLATLGSKKAKEILKEEKGL